MLLDCAKYLSYISQRNCLDVAIGILLPLSTATSSYCAALSEMSERGWCGITGVLGKQWDRGLWDTACNGNVLRCQAESRGHKRGARQEPAVPAELWGAALPGLGVWDGQNPGGWELLEPLAP